MGRSADRDATVDTLDPARLEARLREAASRLLPERLMDDLEVQHLVRVITECSLLLTDVYSDERIARIMQPGRATLSALVENLIREQDEGEGEVLYRIRRLPHDVKVVGDKALFDLGLLGLREVKGYDLTELGSRAYRMAGEALTLLAEDRRLREFFRQNRLLMLPLEEEVIFLNQCSDHFADYARILEHVHPRESRLAHLRRSVPLMAAAARAIAADVTEKESGEPTGSYLAAAREGSPASEVVSRDTLLSGYERIVLFSSLDLDRLRTALETLVVDQQEAIAALCDEFGLFAAGTRDPARPAAYFLVGPTGVGKNHLVETLHRLLEGIWEIDVPMLNIEGPNYTYPSDINELRGATRGFIRSDEEGLLASFHERSSKSPFAIILVDEVEKAHAQLRKFFLSILDRGTTTDNRGQVLDFSNCMVFFTSNLGYSDAQRSAAPIGYYSPEERDAVADQDVRRSLHRALSPEFVNRVRLLHFNRLGRASAERILDLQLDRIAGRYRDVHGLELELAASARDELIRRGFSPLFGARRLATVLDATCNVEVAKKIRRDDRGSRSDRQGLVRWLRELRDGRAFDPEEARRRVLQSASVQLPYRRLRVDFRDGEFVYDPCGSPEQAS